MDDPDFLDTDSEVNDREWDHIVRSWLTLRLGKDPRPEEMEIGRNTRKETRGLALSGGGIRSAAFSLGALQALNRAYVLGRIHYLSTVSGGGYAGSALTWFFNKKPDTRAPDVKFDTGENFPLDRKLRSAKDTTVLEYLRYRAAFLEPGIGLNRITLIAGVLRSVFTSALAFFLMLTALVYVLKPILLDTKSDATSCNWLCRSFNATGLASLSEGGSLRFLVHWPPAASLFAICVAAILLIYVLSSLSSFLPSISSQTFAMRRWGEAFLFWPFAAAALFLLCAVVPDLYNVSIGAFSNPEGAIGQIGKWATTLGPILALVGGFVSNFVLQGAKASSRKPIIGAVLWSSAVVLILTMFVMAYGATKQIELWFSQWWIGFAVLTAVAVIVGVFNNLNYVGLHRFYRDRLIESFLPTPDSPQDFGSERWEADRFRLHDACKIGNHGPYHLINSNVLLSRSKVDMYRKRGGDSFVMAPLYSGSDATGWKRTATWIADKEAQATGWFNLIKYRWCSLRRMTLATAMAISGAAINPRAGADGQGMFQSGLLNFVSTLLNIRLGYWAPNPRAEARRMASINGETESLPGEGGKAPPRAPWRAFLPPSLLHPGVLGGLFSRYKNENARWIELTDGGHFENIGLYELVRRRVKFIIVIDGSADPDFKLSSFANAYERARNDFNVLIDISSFPANFNDMLPDTARPASPLKSRRHLAERGFAIGKITYPKTDKFEQEEGFIYYVNTVLTERLPANLYSYQAEHPDFPDEPTSDQFFDEQQFEAYRELGLELTWDMLKSVALYKDLASGVGLVPTAGENAFKSRFPPHKISSPELLKQFGWSFPGRRPMSIASYEKDRDLLDWPAPPIVHRAKHQGTVATSAKRRRRSK